jgi:hypothetical protein
LLGRVLHRFAGALLGASVPERLAFLRGTDLELTLYPNGVRLSGRGRSATRAHALITESATTTPALQCMSAEGQKLEQRIRSLWNERDRRETVDRRVPQIAGAMADADLEFSDWEILYRQLLQLVVASRGGARLMEGAVRRRQRPGRRARRSARAGLESMAMSGTLKAVEAFAGRVLHLIGRRR